MGGSYLGFFVEAIVALLLMITIGYCLIVNRKLENLRSNKSELREIVYSLNKATTQAEQAIGKLRTTAGTIEESLSEQLSEARALEGDLAVSVAKGGDLLAKLSVLTGTNAPSRGAHASRPQTRPRPAAGRSTAQGAKAAAPRVRHSEVGLGLLNAQQRASGVADAKDVA